LALGKAHEATRVHHVARRRRHAWPIAARAQQPKVPTIGALVIGNISPEEFWREFRQGLRDLGYIEGAEHSI